jgi:hypothetical protein
MDKEKENFYRIITLIMDQGTKAKRELLKCYLATENITLQYFHGKYHVFDYLRKILRCYLPMKRPRKASHNN